MVKGFITFILTALIIFGLCLFEQIFVGNEFKEFSESLNSLYVKIDEETAVKADVEAVTELWQTKKDKLHVYIPHTDISYIDYWLNEAVSLVYTKDYDEALSKIEVLMSISKNLPKTYSLGLENIF